MRKSKARDISLHLAEPVHLNAGSPLKVILPRNNKRTRPVEIDLSETAPLGRIANELAGFLIQSVDGLTSSSAEGRYGSVKRFMKDLTGTVSVPIDNWGDLDWPATVNGWLTRLRTSGLKDSHVNTHRTNIGAVFKLVFRSLKVDRFELSPPIPNPNYEKKPDIASLPQIQAFDYAAMTGEEQEIAHRLEQLTEIEKPQIHLERIHILSKLLRDFASSELRACWSRFSRTEEFLLEESGLDVEQYLSKYLVSTEPLKFRRGWQVALKSESDRMRFLCHPKIYPELISTHQNCIKKWLSETGYSVIETASGLHATTQNVMPILTLVMMDLDLDESSTLTMQRDSCEVMEDEAMVTIKWTKPRSGAMQSEDRPIGRKSALDLTSSDPITSYRALDFLDALTSRLRPYVADEDLNTAFILCNPWASTNVIERLNAKKVSKYFRTFLDPHPILRAFRITPDKLRGTGVLEEQLSYGDILRTQKRARHRKIETTQKYIDTVSVDHQGRSQIREVQDLLLMNALPAYSELRERLGLDENRAEQIAKQSSRSGFLEWFETSGVKQQRKVKERQSAFAQMLLSGDHVILEDIEAAAEFFAYRQHLINERENLLNSGEWEDVWAPMIILLTKYLDVMRADVRLAGEKLAAKHSVEYVEDF